ncbi:hypothetical protein GQ607_015106, partial [Colletotrichum asianum]
MTVVGLGSDSRSSIIRCWGCGIGARRRRKHEHAKKSQVAKPKHREAAVGKMTQLDAASGRLHLERSGRAGTAAYQDGYVQVLCAVLSSDEGHLISLHDM